MHRILREHDDSVSLADDDVVGRVEHQGAVCALSIDVHDHPAPPAATSAPAWMGQRKR